MFEGLKLVYQNEATRGSMVIIAGISKYLNQSFDIRFY
jgi:hypothetical protein